jgi:hypothetical protein
VEDNLIASIMPKSMSISAISTESTNWSQLLQQLVEYDRKA